MTPQALAVLLLSVLPRADAIAWQPSLEGALERASADNRPVLLAVNMDGERANDVMAEEVYADPLVTELAARCVAVVASVAEHKAGDAECPRFGTVTCREHRGVDAEARKRVLESDDRGQVVAPQHVLLAPDGTVLFSVPYAISARELAWCLHEALVEVDRASAPPLPPGARAPKRLVRGGVVDPAAAGEGGAVVLTREAALELIAELRKGARGERERGVRQLLRVDEPEAVDFLRQELGRAPGARGNADARAGRQALLLHAIGVQSPPRFWEVAADFATSSDDRLRAEAAVALEQLAAPDALKTVKAALRKERDPAIERLWLRALASVGAAEKDARRTLLKEARTAKDDLTRASAIVALGWLDPDEDVDEALAGLLEEGEGSDRIAAVCAAGWTRRERWREPLVALKDGPGATDEALRVACETALKLLDGGSARPLADSIRPLTGDAIERERFFPPW